jgi:uncharacterized protein
MPFIAQDDYCPPLLFRNTYVNTIYPSLTRKVPDLTYTRERIDTPDGDFLDLDWAAQGSMRLIVVLHGLESSTEGAYVKGMLRRFYREGWDGLGLNFRGCSGEMNRSLRTYHIGETEDLDWVLQHVLALNRYREIVLIGFSLGGNVVLKYLGEKGSQAYPEIRKGIAISVPCDVLSANEEFNKLKNWIYLYRFMGSLNPKMHEKARLFPHQFQVTIPKPRNFGEFDGAFTAPVHGFDSAEDYWTRNSSLLFIPSIQIPTLLINAQDDTFLSPQCFPYALAEHSNFFHFLAPRYGGHCGFYTPGKKNVYWSEEKAWEFVKG